MEAVEHADVGGERNERVLRGDAGVVQERREQATSSSRSRAAVQAALDKIAPAKAAAPIPAETLRKEREAVAARGGIVPKTAAKVATDEHTWDDFVKEQGLEIGAYPSEEQVVDFAVWMSMRRERACLAQRAEAALAWYVRPRLSPEPHTHVSGAAHVCMYVHAPLCDAW